ncbi:MAG TPA: NapC/NirT family cytochrome c [Dissulfurispiraceae bacterium]|nr:NapC/NirT family cytochrome c [Dissulfurispiraceae bacterium]
MKKLFANTLTLTGTIVVVVNIGFILFLSALQAMAQHPKPYADIIIFMILPAFVFCGVVLIAAGISRERRRQRSRMGGRSRPLVIDFGQPAHRAAVVFFSTAFLLLTLLYAFAGYKAFEYTESDTFCTRICHAVMGPEERAHRFLPHANVSCSSCHVGPGAGYFVAAKLKGTQQLYQVVTNTYRRPVPVPVVDLRPSRDICESCHGPKYTITENLQRRAYYLSDDQNTPWTIDLMLNMGTSHITTDKPPMMHWHYTVAKEIEYATADPTRVAIPWVRAVGFDGKETIYYAKGAKSGAQVPQGAEKRLMDCIDCHNRAGHGYYPGDMLTNILLAKSVLDPSLPGIKGITVKALDATYGSTEEGREGISKTITGFYEKNHPDIWAKRQDDIRRMTAEVQNVYERNYDPHMKVSWKNFPDHKGHLYSPGCFRCHDGNHVSRDGKVLSKDCRLCHLLVKSERSKDAQSAVLTLADYPHPIDVGDSYKEMNCSDCHGAQAQ